MNAKIINSFVTRIENIYNILLLYGMCFFLYFRTLSRFCYFKVIPMKKLFLVVILYMLLAVNAGASSLTNDSYSMNDSVVKTYKINTVEVVAVKIKERISTLPVSANVLSAARLKEQNISSIKEITGLIPNFYMPDYGSKMLSPIFIRGIGSKINSPSVGLYVDGIPYFDRSAFDFNLNDVERIEVLRGPQGTMYGRNTMGGIINVYTKSPFLHKETNIGVSQGNYDNYRLDVSRAGQINDALGYTVSGNYIYGGGYFDNRHTGKKADKLNALSGRIRLGWRINPALVAYLTSTYEYSDQDGYPYGAYNAEEEWADAVDYNAPSLYRRNMSNNGLIFEYTGNNFRLSSQSSFQYFDGYQGLDQDFTPADNYYVHFTQRQQMYSQEVNIHSRGGKSYNWHFGVFGFYQHYDQGNKVENRVKDEQSMSDVHRPTGGFALYHQSRIDNLLTDGLSLTLGLRYDWEKTRMENNSKVIGNTITLPDPTKGKDAYSQFTPKFALQYTFGYDQMAYLSVSRGYKTGGFNTSGDKEEEKTFKPEYSWSYEAGTKVTLANHLLDFDISLFYIDWKDQQISKRFATGQGFRLYNAGKSVSKGVEVTSQIRPLRNLSLLLTYGYTHAKFKEYIYDEQKDIDYSGNFLPMVPRNTFSAAVEYSYPVNNSWLDNVVFFAQYTGLGSLYWNESNTSSQSYYNTINGRVALDCGNISVALWAKNMSNEKYVTYYFEAMGNKFAQRGRPFTIGTNINVKF